MYPTVDEAVALLAAIQAGLRESEPTRAGGMTPRVIVCPPFVSLFPLQAVVDTRLVALGAQNCHWEREGPYTGEISPRMLLGLVDYVMVGHSERRNAGETGEQIAQKVGAVADSGLVPILFVGEDRRDDDPIRHTERRLRHGLSGVDLKERRVLVVYEPAWAIGTDDAAPVARVGAVAEHVKGALRELGAHEPIVIYGGAVADGNIDGFAGLEVLDGVGATRASLDATRFLRLVERVLSDG
jgi:triosephosphate isomerase